MTLERTFGLFWSRFNVARANAVYITWKAEKGGRAGNQAAANQVQVKGIKRREKPVLTLTSPFPSTRI